MKAFLISEFRTTIKSCVAQIASEFGQRSLFVVAGEILVGEYL